MAISTDGLIFKAREPVSSEADAASKTDPDQSSPWPRIGANRINPRLEAVRAPLEFLREGRPGLILDPSCRYLRGGFEARYVWTEEVDTSGNKRKVPNKKLE